MIKAKSVLMTTTAANDGSHFAITELEKALAQNAVSGIPSCLGHDSTRPAAWTVPFGLYLEPGVTRLAGRTWIPETTDEQKLINQLHHDATIARTRTDFEPYKSIFEEQLKDKLSAGYKILSSTFVSCFDEDILHRCYPELMSKADKDGLCYLKDLLEDFKYIGQGVFEDKKSGFAVCAHSYFRKSLFRQNNLNFYFLDALMGYLGKPDFTLRLKLDVDLIGIAETFVPSMEYEYWRGPYFTDDVSKIKLGVAAYGMDEYNKLFNGIWRTEFLWKMEGGEQTFEAEEVKEAPSLGISHDDYGCRYAHSIYDNDMGVFEHFDGAIRMYDADMMLDRWDNDIKSAGKSSIYTKLFRVDGKLPLADWKLLLHHYFQGNHLVEEYLGGSSYTPGNEPTLEVDTVRPLLESLTPIAMLAEEGLRIAVSYVPKVSANGGLNSELYLVGHDTFDEEQLQKIVEVDVIEIKKALIRIGHDLIIPDNYKIVDCYDGMQWNIPEIAIQDENKTAQLLPALLKALTNVFSAKNNPLQTIAFTCSWPVAENRKTVISVMGSSETLIAWLKMNPDIPTEHSKFTKWLAVQETWLDKFSTNFDIPRLNKILSDDGTLYIKRESVFKYVVPGSINFEGPNFEMELKPEFKELYELIIDKKIAYSPTYHIERMTCKECGKDYFNCLHSQVLDGATVDIENFQIIGHYWVNPIQN